MNKLKTVSANAYTLNSDLPKVHSESRLICTVSKYGVNMEKMTKKLTKKWEAKKTSL